RAHKKALEVCRNMENADLREMNLSAVARATARHGDLEAALSIAKGLEKSKSHASTLLMMALMRLEARDIEAAQRLTLTIENPELKSAGLCEIAKAQLDSKQNDEARQTYLEARQLANTAKLTKAPGRLIILQAKLGDLQDALAALDALEDPAVRVGIAKQIMLWLAEKGQIAQAVRLISRIREDSRDDVT